MTNYISISYPTQGKLIPVDHGYLLYSAISKLFPDFHSDLPLLIGPIEGTYVPPRQIQLEKHSRLHIRVPQELFRSAIALAGKRLVLGDLQIRLGVPRYSFVQPSPVLRAQKVYLSSPDKFDATQPDGFLMALLKWLQRRDIGAQVELGKPCKLVVKGRVYKGFGVTLSGLNDADSVRLQTEGFGMKRKQGGGFCHAVS